MHYQLLVEKPGYYTQILNFSPKDYKTPKIILAVSLRPKNCNKVIGYIKGDLKNIEEATVLIYQAAKEVDSLSVRVRPNGSFKICLPHSDQIYFAIAQAAGYTSQADSFLVAQAENVEIEQNLTVSLNLRLDPIEEPIDTPSIDIRTNDTLALKNLQFDQKTVKPKAAEADNFESLVKLFLEHPEVELELSIHTDSRKSERYNMVLAKNRAKYLEKYLLDNGVSANRFTIIPVGEDGLVNKCKDGVRCSDAEHQANNRVAIRVLKGEEALLEGN